MNERGLLPGVRELYGRLGDEITAEVKKSEGESDGRMLLVRALVDQYRTFFTRPWARALSDITDVVLPFSCECARGHYPRRSAASCAASSGMPRACSSCRVARWSLFVSWCGSFARS